jgi:predicted phage terminase large subunit-like protein
MEQTPARHHLAIIRALEDVASGKNRRLILLLPPGSAKSTYTSKLFVAWWFAQHPVSSVILASHTASLSEHFGRGARGLLDEHGSRIGVMPSVTSHAAGRFETLRGGQFFAIGVHGAVTGRRADLALIDDPIASFSDASNAKKRTQLLNWYRTELLTRLKPGGRIILIMTRWHHEDLAGLLIERSGWTTIRFPALAELEDPLGRALGEALWPEWEDRDALLEKRNELGESSFSAMFQQLPIASGGQLFDLRALSVVTTSPPGQAVRAWDLAATEDPDGDPDWTVGVKLLRDEVGSFIIDDVVRFRGSPAEVVSAIRASALADGTMVTIGLPQDPGQAGRSQMMFLAQQLAGYNIVASPETGSKTTRAMPVAAQISMGNFRLRRAHWNSDLLEEMANFPNGSKDDQVDAISRGFAMLLERATPAKFTHLDFFDR